MKTQTSIRQKPIFWMISLALGASAGRVVRLRKAIYWMFRSSLSLQWSCGGQAAWKSKHA